MIDSLSQIVVVTKFDNRKILTRTDKNGQPNKSSAVPTVTYDHMPLHAAVLSGCPLKHYVLTRLFVIPTSVVREEHGEFYNSLK